MYRILIIEDDPALQEGLKELLLMERYSVEQAGDGIAGIEKVLSGKPDLILLDVNLPGKSGFDVCRELRSVNYSNPIIIISSKSDQIDKVLGLELGADDYVTKPFDTRELIARVHANLRKSRRDSSYEDEPLYEKKLCTIFFSDMHGYSEKMNHDETAALKILSEHNSILKSAIKKHGGRVIEIIGDAFLASFESASSAVDCACSIQDDLTFRNKSQPADKNISIRIGIHLGEVFVFPDNIKGDVLNIAARVQEAALPGTVLITASVHDVLKNNKNYSLKSTGSRKLKNIESPVDLFSVTKSSVEAT